ncbi:GMP synthase [Stenotrophomonas maltophilia]|jgi:GMP synthase (glutamine-hydrolysing)|uniref:GMP synthase n=1 Tax=Stenotrophomonas maltophilia TaxID=40324 RepID=A0AAP7KZP4_STEMA|nr:MULTISPECIES: glutamine amidotransferase [Stenotrophomonas]MBE5271997.1 glutamine amidotransferase [Stenotrophomonas sp. B2]MDH2023287.1 glutamine amidotransferase [Stenotrophomonas sp. GD03680]MDI9250425.1 glutamine amidotransferase [Stenotrophomonas sp. RS-48]OBU60187.1 GMP synthase [Stenotrophomonas maltophilia]PZT33803.1 GMP synthase [Stenotrophomonas maltophilia]
MKHAVVLQHIAFEDLGTLQPLLLAQGWQLHVLQAGIDALDAAEAADLLVVLGGPVSVNDGLLYPFLADSIALLQRRLHLQRPTLGICLGAQLMARALGAEVAPSGGKEIGFAPLLLTDEGQRSPLLALQGIPVLHWHGEAFELPDGAHRLASTPACRHQAFSIGKHALALQCHPELDARQFERWLIGHALELAQAGIDPNDLRAQARRYGAPLAAAATAMFNHWLQELPENAR